MVVDDAETEHDAVYVYCEYCEMWLNGPNQWEEHKLGKKHRRATRARQRLERRERMRRRRGDEPAQEPPPG